MTAAENRAIPAREDAPFSFYLDGTRFFPPAGATLTFASMAVDTLTVPGLPVGLVSSSSKVVAKYNGSTVFVGQVQKRVEKWARGLVHVEDVTFEGPWANLNRLVYRQQWALGGNTSMSYARVILNRTAAGLPQDMSAQVREIATFAAAKCGFSVGTIDAGEQVLPADEATDITCAAAIVRTLRFFPKMLARFDYAASGGTPQLTVSTPSTTDAAWVADAKVLTRALTRREHPITCVDIATDVADLTTGDATVDATLRQASHQIAPANATQAQRDGLDALHIYIPLAKGSASNEYETLDCTDHVFTLNNSTKSFWTTHHPRLKDVTEDQIKAFTYNAPNPAPLARLTDLDVGILKHFGQEARVTTFWCKMTIDNGDDTEENVYLTMDFVTTNAQARTYTQQVSSSYEEGESLPEGLAEAILAQRGGELEAEDLNIRLGGALPKIGDAKNGLFLQQMTIDCDDLTASLHFGHPDYLSVEDMRDLLSGFRGRAYSSTTIDRTDPEAPDEDAAEAVAIQPIRSTEFSPGTKKKTTIKSSASNATAKVVIDSGTNASVKVSSGTGAGGKAINLETSALGNGETMAAHEMTWTDADGQEQTAKILATDDIEIPPGDPGVETVNNATGDIVIEGSEGVSVSTSGSTITISLTGGGEEDPDDPENPPEEDPENPPEDPPEELVLEPGDSIQILKDGSAVQTTSGGGTFTIKGVWS